MAPLCPRQSTDGSPSLRCSRCAPFPPHPEGLRGPTRARALSCDALGLQAHSPSCSPQPGGRFQVPTWLPGLGSGGFLHYPTLGPRRERYRYYTDPPVPRPCPPRHPGPRRVSHYPVGKPPSRRAARTGEADPGGRMEQALPRRRARGWGHARRIYALGHSTRTARELVELLRRTAWRRSRTSARCPARGPTLSSTGETLPRTLAKAGLRYVHLPRLGGLRRPRAGLSQRSLAQHQLPRLRGLHADGRLRARAGGAAPASPRTGPWP